VLFKETHSRRRHVSPSSPHDAHQWLPRSDCQGDDVRLSGCHVLWNHGHRYPSPSPSLTLPHPFPSLFLTFFLVPPADRNFSTVMSRFQSHWSGTLMLSFLAFGFAGQVLHIFLALPYKIYPLSGFAIAE
jgi:hypothetical protein